MVLKKNQSTNPVQSNKSDSLLYLVMGAVLTLLVTFIANHISNSEILNKEIREQKKSYINTYLKDLNERAYLFTELVGETANLKEGKDKNSKIDIYKSKLEEALAKLNIDSIYDKYQFKRFFKGKYYDSINNINSTIQYYGQYAEANKDYYTKGLSIKEENILLRIQNIENEIYADLDKGN